MNIWKLLRHPERAVYVYGIRGGFRFLSDPAYLKLLYRCALRKPLNLKNPQTFNEKLQWLKVNNRKPEYTRMVDKYEAKKYVAEKIGEEYIIPTLGVWDRFEDIDFDSLPDQFVLKCTHDSGGLVIVRDKAKLDKAAAQKKIEKSLKRNYYYSGREWPYKDVKPRILAEQYLDEQTGTGLHDYKFYCFQGEPRLLYLSEGLEDHTTAKISFVTLDWEFAEFGRSDFAPFKELPPKPENFQQMIQLAKKLSAGNPFLRVDLYSVQGKIYFSELTFTPCSGHMPFDPENWDGILGEWIKLPDNEERS